MTDELLEIQIVLESYKHHCCQLNLVEISNIIKYEFITNYPKYPLGRFVLTPLQKLDSSKIPDISYYEEVLIKQNVNIFTIEWVDIKSDPIVGAYYAPEKLTMNHSDLISFIESRYNRVDINLLIDKNKPGRYYINDGVCDVPFEER